MKSFLRALVAFTVAVSLPVNPAFAAAVSSDPKQVFELVDKYIAMQKEKGPTDDTGKMLAPTGKSAYMSQAIAVQLLSLEPEDFNLFLFYFVDRYINKPDEREDLFNFIQIVRGMIEADLANTALLLDGPQAQMLEGTYTYGSWILLAGGAMLGWRAILSSPLRSGALVQQMAAREVTLSRSSQLFRYGTRIAGSASLITAASVGAGAIGGYLEYVLKTHRTHRLDPAQILMVVQSQLACQVSYEALQLNTRFEAAVKDEEVLKTSGKTLGADIENLKSQSELLLKQFPWLKRLSVNDRLFQKTLQAYPQAANWQEYRKMLNESAQDQTGQCRQMSMDKVTRELEQMSSDLKEFMTILAPPEAAPETKP